MIMEDDLLALIDLIYEASFDSTLWPAALISLADTMGTAHIGLSTMDFRAQTYDSIAPRTDPVMPRSTDSIGPSIIPFGNSARRGQPARYTYSIA